MLRRIERALYQGIAPDLPTIINAARLPPAIAEVLLGSCQLNRLNLDQILHSANGETSRLLLTTLDGLSLEAVIMRHFSGRTTLCLSSQIGCPMDCSFCATGRLGLIRDLDFSEIVDQLDIARRLLAREGRALRNVVFMGMGEPFLNYAAVSRAIGIFTDRGKYQFGHKHITVSTCGIAEGIEAFGRDHPLASLAISLHAPDDATRSAIMPSARSTPLASLMDSIDRYVGRTGRKVFYEYIMIRGLTDHDWQADALADLLQGRHAQVNFIPWNPGEADGAKTEFAPSDPKTLALFQARLRQAGLPSTIRVSRGEDIAAACGQLAGRQMRAAKRPASGQAE